MKNLLRLDKSNQVFILDFLREYQSFQKRNVFISSNIQDLYSFCEKVWDSAAKDRKTLVVFDEIHNYGKKCPPIEILYRFGRHWNIEIIAISHRFADLPMIVRSQTEQYYIFQVTEKCDLEFLRYSLPKKKVEQIQTLETLEYIIWDL